MTNGVDINCHGEDGTPDGLSGHFVDNDEIHRRVKGCDTAVSLDPDPHRARVARSTSRTRAAASARDKRTLAGVSASVWETTSAFRRASDHATFVSTFHPTSPHLTALANTLSRISLRMLVDMLQD